MGGTCYSEEFLFFIMDDMQAKIDKLEKENEELKEKLFLIKEGEGNYEC